MAIDFGLVLTFAPVKDLVVKGSNMLSVTDLVSHETGVTDE